MATTIGDLAFGITVDDKELKKSIKDIQKDAKTELNNVSKTIDKETNNIRKNTKDVFSGINDDIKSTIKSFVGIGAAIALFNKGLNTLKDSARLAREFETAFAGVRKTLDASESEFTRVENDLKRLARTIPGGFVEFSRIAELGGQLGVAADDIVDFTETIARISASTDLTIDAAAKDFARFTNILQIPIAEIENLASSVVDLGNNFATTEPEILNFSSRIAGAGKIAGLTAGDIFGIATAFTSVGIEAEAGGTAVQKALLAINEAVNESGQDLEDFASVSGLTSEEFQELWEKDAGEAFAKFVEGIGNAGDDAIILIKKLLAEDVRLQRAFLSVAGAGDLLTEAIDKANDAYDENTALIEESNKRFDTQESRVKVVDERWAQMSATIGESINSVWIPISEFLVGVAEKIEKLLGLIDSVRNFSFKEGGFLASTLSVGDSLRKLIDTESDSIKAKKEILKKEEEDSKKATNELSNELERLIKKEEESNKKRLKGGVRRSEIIKKEMEKANKKIRDQSKELRNLNKSSRVDLKELTKNNRKAQQSIAEDNSKAIKSFIKLKQEIRETVKEIEKQSTAEIQDVDLSLGEAVVEQREKIKELQQEINDLEGGQEDRTQEVLTLEEQLRDEKAALRVFLRDNQGLQDEIQAAEEQRQKTGFQILTEENLKKRAEIQEQAQVEIDALNAQVAEERVILDEFVGANREKSRELQDLFSKQRDAITRTQDRVNSFTQNYVSNLTQIGDVTEEQLTRIDVLFERFKGSLDRIGDLELEQGFREGGHTGKGGVVHEDEWVMPKPMVNAMPNLVDKLENMRLGQPQSIDNSQNINIGDVSFQEKFDIMDLFKKKTFLNFA